MRKSMERRSIEGSPAFNAMKMSPLYPIKQQSSNVLPATDIMVKGQLMTLIEVSTARPATMSQRR